MDINQHQEREGKKCRRGSLNLEVKDFKLPNHLLTFNPSNAEKCDSAFRDSKTPKHTGQNQKLNIEPRRSDVTIHWA